MAGWVGDAATSGDGVFVEAASVGEAGESVTKMGSGVELKWLAYTRWQR